MPREQQQMRNRQAERILRHELLVCRGQGLVLGGAKREVSIDGGLVSAEQDVVGNM